MANLLLFDVEAELPVDVFKKVECNELDDYYEHLKCDCFDIATRKIGNKCFDIFVDDCGLLVEDPVISAVDTEGYPMLAGNLIFANHDDAGNTTSLTDEDIKEIQSHTFLCDYKGKSRFIVMCEY